jgi:uncharacterized RDD family membrane protein YckC
MRQTDAHMAPEKIAPGRPAAVRAWTPARYAGLWPRLLAFAADWLLFSAVFFPVTRLVKGVWLMDPTDHRWNSSLFIFDPLCLAFLAIIFGYYIVLEGWLGRTFGKWILGLRVVDVTGNRPGLHRSAVRNLLRMVDGLPAFNLLGILLIARSSDRARFGDRVAGTRVVHSRS